MQANNTTRFLSLLGLITIFFSTNLVVHASRGAGPDLPATAAVRLAWFYKPPADGNLALVAANFETFILTKGNEAARDQLLALGVPHPVWEYLRFEAIMDPGSCTATPWNNQVAYLPGDFCNISSQHPDWFLLTTSSSRIIHLTGTTKFVMMDPGNAGWRAFFLARVSQILAADPVWDGVFLDNVEATNAFHMNAGEVLAAYPDCASYTAAVQGFLQYLHDNYFQPHNKQLLANLIARTDDAQFTSYLTSLDGVMHEGWAIDDPARWRSAATWEKHMALAEQTQAMGKQIILVSHGAQGDLELQKFAFASYLLVMNGKASFRYGSDAAYNQAWLYDTYQINLGAPLAGRYQSGSAWRRDFANGYVSVDPNSHEVIIQVSAAPTATIVPPSATVVPPTVTVIPPTATNTPPTATTVPPTVTSVPPTATAIPPTAGQVSFTDVPASYWAFSYVEKLRAAGVTSGCSQTEYCPELGVSRDQIAVFIERGLHGGGFTPPAASGSVFTDVGSDYWAASWIEQFVRDGITSGCSAQSFCPNGAVTRAQMAVFLLRARHGSQYVPPDARGTVFGDVAGGYWAAAWVEQLAAEGITGGCGGGNFCPETPVNRAQMAVFLVRAFGLP